MVLKLQVTHIHKGLDIPLTLLVTPTSYFGKDPKNETYDPDFTFCSKNMSIQLIVRHGKNHSSEYDSFRI